MCVCVCLCRFVRKFDISETKRFWGLGRVSYSETRIRINYPCGLFKHTLILDLDLEVFYLGNVKNLYTIQYN